MPIRRAEDAYWRDLEDNAHLPRIQELIRTEILNGNIRVRPAHNTLRGRGGLCIVPIRPRPGAGEDKS